MYLVGMLLLSTIQLGLKALDGFFVLLTEKLIRVHLLSELPNLELRLVKLSPVPEKTLMVKNQDL